MVPIVAVAGGLPAYALKLAGLSVVYFALAKAGLALASIHPSATPVWPPTGLALAAMLLWGYGVWPAIFVAAFAANAVTAGTLLSSAGVALGNTIEALASAYLLNRWSRGRATFDTPLGVGKFALASLAPGAMLSATIGIVSLALAGYADWTRFGAIWKTWWLGDVAGALVVTPVIVLWATSENFAWKPLLRSAALFVAAAAVGVIAFSPWLEQTADRGALAFIAVIPLLWAALRHGPRDTASVALILSAFAVWGTLVDGGPFARFTLNESFLLLLAFMLSASVPSLALSADVEVRQHIESLLRRAQANHIPSPDGEVAIHAREEKYRLLIEGVRDYAILMLDPTGRVVSWSPGAARIMQYAAGEIVGRFFGCFYEEEQRRAGAPERSLQIARSAGKYEEEGWRVRKDGSRFWAHVAIDPVRDDAGRLVGFAKVTRDVTERHRAEAALEEARQALQQAQKMEALGQLTGGIAHDFNNILTAITNSLELVRMAHGDDGVQRQRLDRALQAARNGAALVQQLLVFARKQPVQLEPADINRIVAATIEMFARSASENIAIAFDLAPDLRWARVDAMQLQTAILNLAVNARDAMPSGGTLRVATANARRGADAASLPAADCVAITIADNGAGMPPEVLARAFEPFFTTKELGKGTGLGLSMVYSAIRQMGGDVAIESAPKRGTTVRVFLPAVEAPRADCAAEPAAGGAAPGGTTVVYVEDEALVRLATVDLLESAGFSVRAAADGKQALELLAREPTIALMVTDIGLPGMSGYELAAEARRRRPGIRVLFLTGYDRDKSSDAERDARTRYLDKPYQQEDLFEALRELVRA